MLSPGCFNVFAFCLVAVVAEYYGASLNSVVSLLLRNEIWFCRCGTVDVLYNTRLTAIIMVFQTYLHSMIKVMNLYCIWFEEPLHPR